jgi:hypothetical protein
MMRSFYKSNDRPRTQRTPVNGRAIVKRIDAHRFGTTVNQGQREAFGNSVKQDAHLQQHNGHDCTLASSILNNPWSLQQIGSNPRCHRLRLLQAPFGYCGVIATQ